MTKQKEQWDTSAFNKKSSSVVRRQIIRYFVPCLIPCCILSWTKYWTCKKKKKLPSTHLWKLGITWVFANFPLRPIHFKNKAAVHCLDSPFGQAWSLWQNERKLLAELVWIATEVVCCTYSADWLVCASNPCHFRANSVHTIQAWRHVTVLFDFLKMVIWLYLMSK